jgi:hypothetical protein
VSSVAYAPDIAQAPTYKPPPDPFEQIADQYSKIIDQNHQIFEDAGFTPKFMWTLAALMGFYLMSRNRVIFASVETIAARAKVSTRTVKRALAFMKDIGLLPMTAKGIPGKRGGRNDSEYRFNEMHSLWKTLYVPAKKPVQKEHSKCQLGTLNPPAPYIYRETPTPVTVSINRYSSADLRKKPPKKAETPRTVYPVYPEDAEILSDTLQTWLGWLEKPFPMKGCTAILSYLPPEYGGAPAFLHALLRLLPKWHDWRRIEYPMDFIRSKAEIAAAHWTAKWSNTA